MTTHQKPGIASSILPFLAILGAVTFLGLGTSWAKHSLFPAVGAQGTTALRVSLSALAMLLLVRPWRNLPAPADLRMIVLYGAALGAMNLAFYMAMRTLPFGIAVAIEFSGPLGVAILSSRRRMDIVWIALAISGLALLLPLGNQVGALDPVGIAYALATAAFWAAYIVFGKRASHVPTGHSVSLGLVVASMVVLPVGAVHAGMALLDPMVLAVGLGVALLSSAIPISLEMVALRRLPKSAFGIMISVEPAVAALLALALLGERLSVSQWLAIALIISASAGSAVTSRPRVQRATP